MSFGQPIFLYVIYLLSQLLCPLDVHVERNARQLGLIKRPQTDWQTVLELTESLRLLDPKDPIKYDIALFGKGAGIACK